MGATTSPSPVISTGRLATSVEHLRRPVHQMTGKPSSQHVFWHSGFFFLRSFSQLFLHFFMVRVRCAHWGYGLLAGTINSQVVPYNEKRKVAVKVQTNF